MIRRNRFLTGRGRLLLGIVAEQDEEKIKEHDDGNDITRELVVKLNALSKAAGSEKGDFLPIIEEMNRRDAE